MLEAIREQLYQLHLELPKNNLVTWTGGNVSARDPETGLVAIKPSGVRYEELRPEHMVIVDLDGKIVEGSLSPSSDTASHLYIYRHRPDVGGVVHTHSAYATAFAALGRPIPCVLTAMADEFGGPIPCGGFALIGGEEIGKVVVESIGASAACLLKNHGVFTIGKNAARRGEGRGDDRGCGAHRLVGAPTRPTGGDRAGKYRKAALPIYACLWAAMKTSDRISVRNPVALGTLIRSPRADTFPVYSGHSAIPNAEKHASRERSSGFFAAQSKEAALTCPRRRPSTASRPEKSRDSAQGASAHNYIRNRCRSFARLDNFEL